MPILSWIRGILVGCAILVAAPPMITAGDSRVGAHMSEAARRQLLESREAVWRAWFENDRAKLEALIPEGTIAINAAQEEWDDRSRVLESSKAFVAGGGKLVRLEFPKTSVQRFGNVAIIYSHYLLEIERGGKREVQSGRCTEIFLRRQGRWVNPGWHMDSGK